MEPRDLIVGLVAGTVAIVFGIVPGLLSGLTLSVRNFGEQLRFGAATRLHSLTAAELNERPFGLALVGALLIAFTVLAYVWS
jgi:hypothetical protein